MDLSAILQPVLDTIVGILAQLGLTDVVNQVIETIMGFFA